MANGRPASMPVATLRTERLAWFAFPATQCVHELTSKKGVRELLKLSAIEWKAENLSHDLIFYCISLSEQQWVGIVTASWHQEHGFCTLGYSVFPSHRRRGYATESVRTVMQWVFAKTDAEAVIAETFSDWPYSIRVMEKVGLSRVDTDIGPYLVRYGIAKEGSSVDLTEKGALTLAPFSETSSKALLRYLKWLWTRDTGLAALAMLLLFTFVLRGQPWIAVLGGCAFIGFAASMARSFAAWWPTTRRGTYLQFRQRGLFWVSRSGNGSITPWKTFAYWRIPKRKGIELWNSQSWYWIPPQAFTDSSLGLAQAFLIEHGVKLGNPPGPFFDEE